MKPSTWLHCPACGSKTRLKLREDTELRNFPLFCPKCRQEILIHVNQQKITIINEPDALDAEPIRRE
ncbi:MAG: cysteine-rich KTR domain-containing protein [Planctomycetia bacterium]|nr:cysteine-rich KTR domain-containing protein [Planctomycetia bacterium]